MKPQTAKSIFQYLINTPILDNEQFLHAFNSGSLKIIEIDNENRNTNFIISLENISILLLKQVSQNSESRKKSLINEANFHELLIENNLESTFIFFDKVNFIIIHKFYNKYNSIKVELFSNYGSSIKFARDAGIIVYSFHDQFSKIRKKSKYLSYYKPLLLDINTRNNLILKLNKIENINIRSLTDFIEKEEELFEEISKLWICDTIIHRDLKFDNFIINENEDFKLIDWELAALGDRYWDIAGFIYIFIKEKSGSFYTELNKYLSLTNLLAYANEFLNIYRTRLEVSEEVFFKKVLVFFTIMLIENYIAGVENDKWDESKIHLEYQRVLYFKRLIENFNRSDFSYSSFL